jgi:hypothetical protein
MTTPHTDLPVSAVDEATEPQSNQPEPVLAAHRLCRWCLLESVLSIILWVAIAVAITKLIDWYGWSSWWLVGVAVACLAAAYLLVDLGYTAAAAWRERRIRRAFAEPPAGGDR